MDSLVRRGAIVPDFPSELERILTDPIALDESSKQEWFTYDKLHRFYFAQTHDPRREALLRERLHEIETGSKPKS